jgi:hypothetical protein
MRFYYWSILSWPIPFPLYLDGVTGLQINKPKPKATERRAV